MSGSLLEREIREQPAALERRAGAPRGADRGLRRALGRAGGSTRS